MWDAQIMLDRLNELSRMTVGQWLNIPPWDWMTWPSYQERLDNGDCEE